MLEWYRVGEGIEEVMQDCQHLARIAAQAAGTGQLTSRGLCCDPFAPPEVLNVCDAFLRHAGIELEACLDDVPALRRAVEKLGIGVPDEASWTDLFSAVLVTQIEPHLGRGRLTFLCQYPISEAALARPLPEDGRFAERFEMYACGIELANGYNELTDPDLLKQRQQSEMDLREVLYGDRHPLDPDFIAAVAVMPEASGTALGFDRLVMLACGADDIRQVRWTPPPLSAGEAGYE
jgi:lysyl-tRNA synthetase class 2